jgi:hypothetical protein
MPVRFFKQSGHPAPLYIFNGTSRVSFETIDNSCSYKAVENPDVIAELEKAIRTQVGGIVEVTAAEYEDFQKKKKVTKLPPSLKEEWGLPNALVSKVAKAVTEKAPKVVGHVADSQAPAVQFRPTPTRR